MSNRIQNNQLNTGTDIGQIPVLEDVDGNPGLPAVDASQLLNLPSGFDSTIVENLDEFNGFALDTSRWDTNLGSDANAFVLADGGLCTIQPGLDAANTMATNGAQLISSRYLRGLGTPSIEALIAVQNPSLYSFYFGLTVVSTLQMPFEIGGGNAVTSNTTSGCGFAYDSSSDSDTIWLVGVKNNVDATHQNSGATFTNFILKKFRIDIDSSGTATFYINDVQVGTPMANAINTGTNYHVTVAVMNKDGVSAANTFNIDYIRTTHTRAASV